jgi:hypothetical protein
MAHVLATYCRHAGLDPEIPGGERELLKALIVPHRLPRGALLQQVLACRSSVTGELGAMRRCNLFQPASRLASFRHG